MLNRLLDKRAQLKNGIVSTVLHLDPSRCARFIAYIRGPPNFTGVCNFQVIMEGVQVPGSGGVCGCGASNGQGARAPAGRSRLRLQAPAGPSAGTTEPTSRDPGGPTGAGSRHDSETARKMLGRHTQAALKRKSCFLKGGGECRGRTCGAKTQPVRRPRGDPALIWAARSATRCMCRRTALEKLLPLLKLFARIGTAGRGPPRKARLGRRAGRSGPSGSSVLSDQTTGQGPRLVPPLRANG